MTDEEIYDDGPDAEDDGDFCIHGVPYCEECEDCDEEDGDED